MVRDREQEEKRRHHRDLLVNIVLQGDVIGGRNKVHQLKPDAQKIIWISENHRKLNFQITAAIIGDLLTLLEDEIYPLTHPKERYAPEPVIEPLQALFLLLTELIELQDMGKIKRFFYLQDLSAECELAQENVFVIRLQNILELFQQQMSIHPGHIKVWQELSVWLTGVYWSVATHVSADERATSLKYQDSHLVIDIEDRLLRSYLGITKLDIYQYFLHIANEITRATRVDYRAHPAQEQYTAVKVHRYSLFHHPVCITTEFAALSCPITFELMRRAMFCTLDGHAYEEKEVRDHLHKKRFAPLNNVKMLKEESVDDVLKPHLTLRHILKNFKSGTLLAKQLHCPIAKKPLTNAVFCLLNNTCYDEAAIKHYLATHHETPDKIPIKKGERIDKLLVADYTLRDLATELLSQDATLKPKM